MTSEQYAHALTTLSLTSRDVCAWLGVSRRGEALWRENGPSNLAGRLIEMRIAMEALIGVGNKLAFMAMTTSGSAPDAEMMYAIDRWAYYRDRLAPPTPPQDDES